MLRLQYYLFISLLGVFCAPSSFAADEVGESQVSVTGIEAPNRLEAGAELESGGKWQSASESGLNHNLILSAGYSLLPGWRLGLDSEAVLTSSAGDPGGFLDTELTVARTGLSLGDLGELSAASLTILPTAKAERDAGMQLAQGAILAWGLEPAAGVTLGLELKGSRFFRDHATANRVATPYQEATDDAPAVPATFAASAADQWRFEQKLSLGWAPARKVSVEVSAKHGTGWKWFGGREDLLTTEQLVSYEIDAGWSLGLGHRNEAKLLAQDGTRARVALFRPEESKLFGTLAWEM